MVDTFAVAALGVMIFMIVFFIIAQLIKDNSIVDIGWGLGFCLIAIVSFLRLEVVLPRHFLLSCLIILWGLRLAIYILIRNWGKGEDFRYQNFRQSWGNHVLINAFLRVFVLQGVLMLLIALPIIIVNSSSSDGLGLLDYIGAVLWLTGFLFESIGDFQLFLFKKNPVNKGKIMDRGLWRYTRHPNYFGESLLWWGIFFISIGSGLWYISIISPVLLTFMLTRVSGVTMLEKKYEADDAYGKYKATTSPFFPWFPKNAHQ